MELNRGGKQQRKAAGTVSVPATQAERMRTAIDQAVAAAPSFLRGEIEADHMAKTMIQAVNGYAEQERAAGGDGMPRTADAQRLQPVLDELMGCGSGYLANRCDAACVARTMTEMIREFGPR